MKRPAKPVRLILLGEDVAGFCSAIATSGKRDGIIVKESYRSNPFGYSSKRRASFPLGLARDFLKGLIKSESIRKLNSVMRDLRTLASEIAAIRPRGLVVISGLPSQFRSRILFWWLEWLRCNSFLVLHGTDARPIYLNGKWSSEFDWWSDRQLLNRLREQQSAVKTASEKADFVLTWKALGPFIRRPIFLFEELGFPIIPAETESIVSSHALRRKVPHPTIVHCPSSPNAKGTNQIVIATDNLRRKGYSFELKQVSGVSNKSILIELSKADLVVDQAFSDNLSGVFAREAAQFGVPVIIAGESLEVIEEGLTNRIPFIICRPNELEETIEGFLGGRGRSSFSSIESKKYFRDYCDASVVLDRIMAILAGRIPIDVKSHRPEKVEFGFGGYAAAQTLSGMVRRVIAAGGRGALGLQDKPNQLRRLLDHYGLETLE